MTHYALPKPIGIGVIIVHQVGHQLLLKPEFDEKTI